MVKCRVQEIAFKRFRSCILNKSHYKVLRSLTDCISPWWSPRYVHKRGCGDRHQITPQMYQNIHSASHYYLILNGTLRSRNNDRSHFQSERWRQPKLPAQGHTAGIWNQVCFSSEAFPFSSLQHDAVYIPGCLVSF